MEFILGAEEYLTQSVSECKRVYCAVRLKRKKKPEGLARIQAGGKRSATPATGHIVRKPRMGGRILQQCVSTLLWSATPSGFWILSLLSAGVIPLPVVCYPFGVYWGQLDSKEFFRVSCVFRGYYFVRSLICFNSVIRLCYYSICDRG